MAISAISKYNVLIIKSNINEWVTIHNWQYCDIDTIILRNKNEMYVTQYEYDYQNSATTWIFWWNWNMLDIWYMHWNHCNVYRMGTLSVRIRNDTSTWIHWFHWICCFAPCIDVSFLYTRVNNLLIRQRVTQSMTLSLVGLLASITV